MAGAIQFERAQALSSVTRQEDKERLLNEIENNLEIASSSVKGLTTEEKDPKEFLNSLLAQILRADPFLKVSKI